VIGDKQNTVYRSPITYHFDARTLSGDVQRRDYATEIWMSPLPKQPSRHAVKRDG
jgi:hypothetical protein